MISLKTKCSPRTLRRDLIIESTDQEAISSAKICNGRTAVKLDVGPSMNGTDYALAIEPRRAPVDFIREEGGLASTHIGCERGVCEAYTALLDGEPVFARRCTGYQNIVKAVLAAQVVMQGTLRGIQ